MKNNHTDITVVLDCSGSMSTVANDTIEGFNRFLADQQKAPGTAAITLYQFNDEFLDTTIQAQDIKTAPKLTDETFVPRGFTALLDAIGHAVTNTGERLDKMPVHDRPGKVVFVILTDGEENSSHEYTREKIFEMIKHQREKYSWEFVFLGADQDAIQAGQRLGVSFTNCMTYAKTVKGTLDAFAATASNLSAFRSGATQSIAYTASQHAEQQKEGAHQSSTPVPRIHEHY